MERLKERIDTAQKALTTLQEVLSETNPTVILRDAAIQRFEYTFEAVWKAGQEFLRSHEGLDVGSPKGTIRGLFQTGHLNMSQAEIGLKMVDDRNLTAHTYVHSSAGVCVGLLISSWLSPSGVIAVRR